MEKLTAVEWLVEQIFGEHTKEWKKEIKQALQMEKEQITGAYLQAKMENLNMENTMGYYDILEQNKIKAEQLYINTYEK